METLPEQIQMAAMDLFKASEEDEHLSPYAKDLLREYATLIGGLAQEVEDEYVLVDKTGEVPTVAQGVALARFLRPEFNREGIAPGAHVSRGGAGLPKDYLHVYFPSSGYEGGIDRDGRTST